MTSGRPDQAMGRTWEARLSVMLSATLHSSRKLMARTPWTNQRQCLVLFCFFLLELTGIELLQTQAS